MFHRLVPDPNLLILSIILISLAIPSEGQTRRALLIGINSYAPPAGAKLPVPAAGHASDSRFASGDSWPGLRGPLVDIANMQVLLKQNFGFQDIRVLTEQDATRQGILAAIDKLVADTQHGDFDVLYYAGHGSRRLDTLSSKNHFDETIVPIDAWKGVEDIRDKELARRFNQIVYDKQAHLTAIFDSCNSGTMARGVTASVVRALPYDDRDVAYEKKKDPATIVETDLKQIPQNGDAIILAAAASNETAAEALYSDDREWHGAFSRALAHVLRSSTVPLSANDVVAEVANMLHADPTPFQQPSVEGRTGQSLFGDPVPPHPLHAHVVKAVGVNMLLDVGSAAGFDTGTQFTALEPGAGGQRTVIEVHQINEPLASTAQIVSGPPVKVGQVFELTKLTYPRGARLVVFTSKSEPDPASATAKAKASFPGLSWVDDPADQPIDFLVADSDAGWVAYNQSGQTTPPGPDVKGSAYLLLGPPASLRTAIEQSPPFQRSAFSFTTKPSEANYLLAMRQKSGTTEYAFFDPIVLAPHKSDAWVKSTETDPDDAKLNNGKPPEVVCRNDVSLPVRTAWLPSTAENSRDFIVALNRRMVRLGKLRVWLQSAALSPGAAGWPYHLTILQPNTDTRISGPLHLDQEYEVRLVTTPDERASLNPIPKYVYVFGSDCAANPFLLYPPRNLNGDATLPQPGADGVYGLSIPLQLHEAVSNPLGADTIFVLVSAQKLTDTGILIQDGVLDRGTRGGGNRFDELVADMSDAGTRGPREVPGNWLIQQLVIPSR